MSVVDKAESNETAGTGNFLTNFAHVLICLNRSPDARLRDVASEVGITERAVQRIVADLEKGGFLTRHRDGRRNHYVTHMDRMLCHRVEIGITVGKLIALFMLGGTTGENVL